MVGHLKLRKGGRFWPHILTVKDSRLHEKSEKPGKVSILDSSKTMAAEVLSRCMNRPLLEDPLTPSPNARQQCRSLLLGACLGFAFTEAAAGGE